MDQQQNSKEEAIKRKHSEEDDPYYYPSPVRAKTSSPNELTPQHHHIISSQPPSLNPFLSDHTIISPRLGFPPSKQELLPIKLTTKPKNTIIDFMGLSPPSQLVVSNQEAIADPPSEPPPRPPHTHRGPTQGPKQRGKSETITPPFPWATNRRAVVHNFNYLLRNKILTITGDVSCKRCERKFKMEFVLKEKFSQVWKFIAENRNNMHDRAPDIWMNPVLPTCMHCGHVNCVKPITQDVKKKSLNWLFLLLGQMLGCCTLEQLKYFCKHTKNHRTGAKDRVLYLTYLALCKQLDPQGPFDR